MKTQEWKEVNWPDQLAKLLKVDKLSIHAQYGCSNNYISWNMRQQHQNIKPGDRIVVVTTSIKRWWWFKDLPYCSNSNATSSIDLTSKQIRAIEHFMLELQDNEVDQKISLENMIAWVYAVSHHLNSSVAIIPGFEHIKGMHTCTGSLYEVDWKEHDSNEQEAKQLFLDKNDNRDPKDCHLSEHNHIILAEKLYDHFTYQQPIDLTTGFKQNIIF
jgi:hypothetical protein